MSLTFMHNHKQCTLWIEYFQEYLKEAKSQLAIRGLSLIINYGLQHIICILDRVC